MVFLISYDYGDRLMIMLSIMTLSLSLREFWGTSWWFGAILTICSPGCNIQINPLKQPHSETLVIYQICFFKGNWYRNDDEMKFNLLHAIMGSDFIN